MNAHGSATLNTPDTERPEDSGSTAGRVLRYALSFKWAYKTSEACLYISGVAMVSATLIMVHGVLMRYLLGRSTIWQTESAIYLLLVVAFFGAAYGVKQSAHVGVDLLVDRLSPRRRTQVKLCTDTLSLMVLLVVVYTAGLVWLEALTEGWLSFTSWRAPLGVVYAIVPVGMLLAACQFIRFIIEGVQALRSGTEHLLVPDSSLPTNVPSVSMDVDDMAKGKPDAPDSAPADPATTDSTTERRAR